MSKTLEIRPIRNNADYERALKQLELVWDAKAGTADEDVLDVLATLIDAYEDKHFPIDTPDPVRGHPLSYGAAGSRPEGLGAADRLARAACLRCSTTSGRCRSR